MKPKYKMTKKIYTTGGSKFALLPKNILDFWGTDYIDISFVNNKLVIEPNYEKEKEKENKKGA